MTRFISIDKLLQPRLALPQWLRRLSRSGWPVVTGLVAFLFSGLMAGASWYLVEKTKRLQTKIEAQQSALAQSSPTGVGSRSVPVVEPTAPDPKTHLDDLGRLFGLAKEQGVAISTVAYRAEASADGPVLARKLNVRIRETYPRLKGFVASVLSTMPNVYVEEIRVERQEATAIQEQFMLKLAFSYALPSKGVVPAVGPVRFDPSTMPSVVRSQPP
jgi:hypothetical protein